MPRPSPRNSSCTDGTGKSPTATELVSAATPGFRKDFVISENGNLSFSKDGTQSTSAPRRQRRRRRPTIDPTEEKAVVDLWSYKDDYLQPHQKLRAARDRNRIVHRRLSRSPATS